MSWWRKSYRSDWKLWFALSAALFIVGGFVNLWPDIKGTEHFWGQFSRLQQGDYSCSSEEMRFSVAFVGLLVAVPAVVLGWLLHALICMASGVVSEGPNLGFAQPGELFA